MEVLQVERLLAGANNVQRLSPTAQLMPPLIVLMNVAGGSLTSHTILLRLDTHQYQEDKVHLVK